MRSHMKNVLCVLLQIGEYRPRLGRVPIYSARVIVLLVELHVVADYLAVSMLSKWFIPGNAHGVGSLKKIRQVRRWPRGFTFRAEPVSHCLLAEADVIFARYSELVINALFSYRFII